MALAYRKQIDPDSSFAIWKIEESAEELYNQLQLKEHESSFLETLNKGKRNLHWLSTRVLLRTMLNTDEYIDCRIDEHGKPYLESLPYQISLSHSFDYAAVIISKTKAVGIDIELIKNKIERIAGKFLNKSEIKFIDNANSIEHMYVCWCAKEAIYKLQGKRNVSFLDHIFLESFAYNESGCFNAKLKLEGNALNFKVHYEKFHDYMIGYVAE